MNRVERLREVVKVLTPMLAGKGLTVTQIGTQAKAVCDKNGKPIRINIPHIADDADEAFCRAIQGFIDHEVAHVLFTDFDAVMMSASKGADKAKDFGHKPADGSARMHSLHNIVEDTYIERKMCDRFKGTGYNLDQLYDIFINKITLPALKAVKGDAQAEFNVILVPLMRAWSGQPVFKRFMDDHKLWDNEYVKEFVEGVPQRVIDRIPTLQNSWESLEVADELYNIMYPSKKKEPPPPPAPPSDEPGEGCEGGEPSDEKSDSPTGKGENTDKPEDKDDKGSKGEKPDEKPEPSKKDESDADGEPGDSTEDAEDPADKGDEAGAEDGKPEANERDLGDPDDGKDGGSDESGDDADEADSGEEEDDEAGEGGDSAAPPPSDEEDDGADAPDKDAAGSDGTDDADESGEESSGGEAGAGEEDGEAGVGVGGAAGDDEGGGGDEKGEAAAGEATVGGHGCSKFDDFDADLSKADISDAIAQVLGDEALRQSRNSDYRIVTKDWDKIEVPEDDLSCAPYVGPMEEAVRHMIGPMQKSIERMMAARSQVVKVPGFRSGRLHGGSLHRLQVQDDRVFRRVQENKSKETAVTLLIDNSGSMGGSKIDTAMKAGFALSSTLERVGIKHEVLGFTTLFPNPEQSKMIYEEKERLGEKSDLARFEPIHMPIYKGFEERLNPVIKRRFVKGFHHGIPLLNNVDGESVRYAGQRLLQRREVRKVMIVLSDGNPACSTEQRDAIYSDLHRAIAELEKARVEVIGLGIQSRAVKTFYKKHSVLNDLNALPGAVMGELQRILTAA